MKMVSMAETPINCAHCGVRIEGDDKFCPHCGAQVAHDALVDVKAHQPAADAVNIRFAQLKDFVSKCKEQGHTNERIKTELLKAGWSEEIIFNVLPLKLPDVPPPVNTRELAETIQQIHKRDQKELAEEIAKAQIKSQQKERLKSAGLSYIGLPIGLVVGLVFWSSTKSFWIGFGAFFFVCVVILAILDKIL